MRTRYGVSPWIDTFPSTRRPDHPRLRGEHSADVVIVGGGLTGCATAYACAAAGLRPLVIEGNRLGFGSAGRSAGLLLPDPGVSFRDIVGAHGLRAARRVFEGYRKAASDGATTLRRLNIRCDLVAIDDVLVANREGEKEFRREREAREAAGLDARWMTGQSVRRGLALDVEGALKLGSGVSFDPYRACLGLASAARSRRATLFERSPVKKIRLGRNQVEVIVDGGLVRAETVIVTTGVATAEFKPLRRHFKSRATYLVLTEPLPAAIRKQLGGDTVSMRDMASPRHRLRRTKDGRLLIAGADRDESPERQRDAVRVQRTGQLMYELLMMYPVISGLQPEYGWEMVYGETADRLMYIGPHRNYPRHLFALGSSGDTLAGAFLAARILARAARGELDKADEVFGWTR
ncbi:MAG TPA: FAD-binding oxidoreductase [Vicinamibacterales bacterium]|jgi:glycine/D-amino acid oxidase-like deaminating enzyme|nr:FAD-binding oxidoreductase [Vicinamibacterales bacterium]